MAGKTNTEKIDELLRSVYSLLERVKAIEADIAELPALSTHVAVLEQQLADQRKHHEQQLADLKEQHHTLVTRLLLFGVPLLVTIIGGLLTALLRK